METHGSRKWYPPPRQEAFLIPGRGDIIFINKFLLREGLSPAIVDILECTKRTESGMRKTFHVTDPQKQVENSDPHELTVLFLVTLVKKDSSGKAALSNLSELEEPP